MIFRSREVRPPKPVIVNVFLRPGASSVDVSEVEQLLHQMASVVHCEYLDAGESLAQFKARYARAPDILEGVRNLTPEATPSLFRCEVRGWNDVAELRITLLRNDSTSTILAVHLAPTPR